MDAAHATPASETAPEALLPHPSRSAPLCPDCRHCQPRDGKLYCNHPTQPVGPYYGHAVVLAACARFDLKSAKCGEAGRLFEPKDQPPHPSRSAPLCRDCRHAHKSFSDLKCNLPEAPIDPQHGHPMLWVRKARAAGRSLCGPEGRRFEPAA